MATSSSLPSAVAWRSYVAQLYLSNKESSVMVHQLLMKADAAGAMGAKDLVRSGMHGKHPKNLPRDLMRKLTKGIQLPEPYMASIPVKDPKTGLKRKAELPFLLPHEMLYYLVDSSRLKMEDITNTNRKDFNLASLVASVCSRFQVNPQTFVPLGFHGDGVAHHKGLKKASTEVYSWNLLSIEDSERILFTCVSKSFLCGCGCKGRCTIDAILQVFSWSMQVLLSGQFPSHRHDGAPIDSKRHRLSGPLGFHGGLLQARGDWMFYNSVFGFPHWGAEHICWKCRATKAGFKDFGPDAPWRSTRLSSIQFLQLQRHNNVAISPLFDSPGFSVDMVCIGVLHTMDLGVTQVALGALFYLYLLKGNLPGRAIAKKVPALWAKVQAYNKQYKPPSCLSGLTIEMIKRQKKTPCLKAKGAETRYLVPFGVLLAEELWKSKGDPQFHLVWTCMTALHDLYMLMSVEWDASLGAQTCRRFLTQYKKLHVQQPLLWPIKPKFHLLQELFEFQGPHLGNPKGFWEYKDEGFVGWISTLASSRGGPGSKPSLLPQKVLLQYRALSEWALRQP